MEEKPFERDVCLLQLNLPQKIATFASRRQRTSTKEQGRSARKQLKPPEFSDCT